MFHFPQRRESTSLRLLSELRLVFKASMPFTELSNTIFFPPAFTIDELKTTGLSQDYSFDHVVCFTFRPVWFYSWGFGFFRPLTVPSKRWLRVHAAARSLWRHGDAGHHCPVILIKAGFDWPCWLMAGLWPCERVYVQNWTESVRRRIRVYSRSTNREIPQKHKPIQQRWCLCWQTFLLSRTDDCCPYQLSAAIITEGELRSYST